jgi:hypothetical protein
LFLIIEWQREEKPAALSYFALQPNPSAVHLDKLLRQRQAQPRALRFSGVTSRLLKLLKDPFLIF